jgi:D-glycero-D-manno-heptose 1,7-bisphosphate phosphatase
LLRILFSEIKAATRGPAIFIDRDGVINRRRPGDYVLDWSQFIFMPGIREALKHLSSLGLPMIIISNQAAVGKGLLDPAGLEEITNKMHQVLAGDGTFLAAAYYCTHRPDENCPCRKPKPGLLHRAADDFDLDRSRSVFIGDSETDILAAKAAACRPVLFDIGPRSGSAAPRWTADLPVARAPQQIFPLAAKFLRDEITNRS